MTSSRRSERFVAVAMTAILGAAAPAFPQTDPSAKPAEPKLELAPPSLAPAPVAPVQSWSRLFTDTIRDFRRLPSKDTAEWLAVGAVAALGTHPADSTVSRTWARSRQLGETVESGRVIGSTPFQLGAAATAFAIGRATNKPRVAEVSADLIRAQLLAEAMTIGVKQSVRRNRPEGSGFAFPSGHTTASFASATVLERHFGWRVGVPAYAVAGLVGISRVQMRRHNLSDVAFGAALGIVAGRTVTIGQGRRLELAPLATPDGAGVSFTWLGRK
jgi:membrane-associated phospholipid phosphatase